MRTYNAKRGSRFTAVEIEKIKGLSAHELAEIYKDSADIAEVARHRWTPSELRDIQSSTMEELAEIYDSADLAEIAWVKGDAKTRRNPRPASPWGQETPAGNERYGKSGEILGYMDSESPMTINASSLANVLKVLYAGQQLENVIYDESARPFFTMLKKFKQFGGSTMPFPLKYSDGNQRSVDFATAQAYDSPPLFKKWAVDVSQNHYVAPITTEAILRASTDKQAFLNSIKDLIDTGLSSLANDVEASLFRDGTGAIGHVAVGGVSSATVTLDNAEDIVNFSEGQEIVAAASKTAALNNSGTAGVIKSVNRDTGVMIFTAAVSGTNQAAAGDYLYVKGDRTAGATPVSKKILGLEAWLPATAPVYGDSFLGVDRSVDTTRLAGVRYVGNSGNIESSIVGAMARLGRESSAIPDLALMSYATFAQLIDELGSKVLRPPTPGAKGGFQAVEVYGPKGPVKCVPCTFCPGSVIYLLTSKGWQLVSMGEPIRIQDFDGSKLSRKAAEDSYEVRIMSWCNLVCQRPGDNVRIAL